MKDEAHEAWKKALDELRRSHSKVVATAAAAVGSTLGGAASFTALYFGGAVVGLSAAGLTSGLAVAGALVGGGMAAASVRPAAPVAIFGVAGYAIAKKRRKAKLAARAGQSDCEALQNPKATHWERRALPRGVGRDQSLHRPTYPPNAVRRTQDDIVMTNKDEQRNIKTTRHLQRRSDDAIEEARDEIDGDIRAIKERLEELVDCNR